MIHESRKVLKYTMICMLLVLVVFSLNAAMNIHWFFWFLSFGLSSCFILIRFKRLQLAGDHLVYEDRSIIPFLNQKTTISINSITQIEDKKEYVDKEFLFHEFIGLRDRGSVLANFVDRSKSHPHTLTIRTADNKVFSTIKFGDPKSFNNIVEKIKKTVANNGYKT